MLSIVCAYADQIRAALSPTPTGAALVEQVVQAARTNQNVASGLHTLHQVLQSRGDTRGIYAYSEQGGPHGVEGSNTGRGLHLAGIDAPRPGEADYRCPDGRCARSWQPDPASQTPTCHISGQALRRTPRA